MRWIVMVSLALRTIYCPSMESTLLCMISMATNWSSALNKHIHWRTTLCHVPPVLLTKCYKPHPGCVTCTGVYLWVTSSWDWVACGWKDLIVSHIAISRTSLYISSRATSHSLRSGSCILNGLLTSPSMSHLQWTLCHKNAKISFEMKRYYRSTYTRPLVILMSWIQAHAHMHQCNIHWV